MSKRKKLLQKLKDNPKGRTRQDIVTLLGSFGFVLERASGSHHSFVLREGISAHRITVPIHGQQVKSVYVKQIVEQIEALFPEQERDDRAEEDEA